MELRHPCCLRGGRVKVGLDLDSPDLAVSNRRPEDPPSMSVGLMLAVWARVDSTYHGNIIYNDLKVATSAQN
jgi:hypothetical protein